MSGLHKHFNDKGGLTWENVVEEDVDVMKDLCKKVHYGNSKITQIITASSQIGGRFKGDVPEGENELKEITGVGEKLAGILKRVNTKERGREYMNWLERGENDVEIKDMRGRKQEEEEEGGKDKVGKKK